LHVGNLRSQHIARKKLVARCMWENLRSQHIARRKLVLTARCMCKIAHTECLKGSV
jgi:hypothetical protein